MKRYDLITNYRCGSAIEEMEPSDDGEWVRFEDVATAHAALAGLQGLVEKLLKNNGGPTGGDEYFGEPDTHVLVDIGDFKALEAALTLVPPHTYTCGVCGERLPVGPNGHHHRTTATAQVEGEHQREKTNGR